MTRKIIVLILAVLFIAGTAYAAPQPKLDNFTIMDGYGGPTGTTPPTIVKLVRHGNSGLDIDKMTSGDVVVWDTTSADGFTVTRCTVDLDATYAGVLVTDIQSPADSKAALHPGSQRNWGYMAVRGYCLAKTDSTGQTAGNGLVPNGATLEASFVCKSDGDISNDRGVNLAAGGTDRAMPTWLGY